MTQTGKNNINAVVQECIKDKLPFVFYRLPGNQGIHFMGERKDGAIKEAQAQGFMFNPLLRSDKTPAQFIRKDIYDACILEDLLDVKMDIATICGEDSANIKATREEYIEQVKKAVKAIKQEKLEKVVLSRIEKATVTEKNPVNFFAALCKRYPSAFISLVVFPGKTVWLTATPELLVSLEGDTVRSVSIAGTKPADSKVAWGEKEKIEQQMVTDYIYKVFVNNCVDVESSGTEDLVAGNVAHLRTAISGTLNTGMYQLLYDLHPTPAVCGLPKDSALEFIRETEKHDRKYYTGYLGPCNMNGKTEWYVNLRCAELFNGRANLFIGGGITADSEPEKEWNETILKAQTLLSVIAPTIKAV